MTIGLALILAIGGFAVVLRAFRDNEARTPTQDSTGPKANGVIWFRVGGGDGPSFIYESQPDGSGERLVFGSETERLRYSQVAWSGRRSDRLRGPTRREPEHLRLRSRRQ